MKAFERLIAHFKPEKEEDNWELNWGKHEIKAAKQYVQNSDESGDDTDALYMTSCLDSAYKAFEAATKSLWKDGHSGYSHAVTVSILKKMLDNEPLCPIDVDPKNDEWEKDEFQPDNALTNHICYHHKRRHSLSMWVYDDGHIEYHDHARIHIGFKTDEKSKVDYGWYSGFIGHRIDEMFPIINTYTPTDIYVNARSKYAHTSTDNEIEGTVIDSCIIDDITYPINRYYIDNNEVSASNFWGVDWDEPDD